MARVLEGVSKLWVGGRYDFGLLILVQRSEGRPLELELVFDGVLEPRSVALQNPHFSRKGRARNGAPNTRKTLADECVRRYVSYWALKNRAARGGNVSLSEKGRACMGISSAWTPPRLPMPLPAYSRASLLSISRQ